MTKRTLALQKMHRTVVDCEHVCSFTFICMMEIVLTIVSGENARYADLCQVVDIYCNRIIDWNQYPLLTYCFREAAASYPGFLRAYFWHRH